MAFHKKLKLRRANISDCEILWKWRNEEETRRYSFSQDVISLKDHKKWFSNAFKRRDIVLYIAVDEDNKPVGQVRLNKNGTEAEINIGIDKERRGKGYGTVLLKLISDIGFAELGLKKLIGYIKTDNKKSVQAFLNAGYINNGVKVIKGNEAVEMVLERK